MELTMKWFARLRSGKQPSFVVPATSDEVPTAPGHPCRIRSVDDLWNLIAYVVLRAPDRFPVEDFLADDQQMTLDRAFELLRDGIVIAYPDQADAEKRGWLNDALDRSLDAYRQGDDVGGAHILQDDFQDAIFKQD